MLSRLAPTPSGYLHLGNLASFALTERLVAKSAGALLLRIDDCDGTRARREFVDHIFETLDWLGFAWQKGPKNPEDFYQSFSQTKRSSFYFGALKVLEGRTYACDCSRKSIQGVYPGTCRERGLAFVPGVTALRLRVEDPALAVSFGDVVLWRKDNGPAYHWASVVDDLHWGVDLVVRGEDLQASSQLQKHIAALVKPGGFRQVQFVHHPLLAGEDGQKLAKSRGSHSVLDLRQAGATPAEVRARMDEIIHAWGFS